MKSSESSRPDRPRTNTPSEPAATIGEQIRSRRQSKEMSQEQLAVAAETTARSIGTYERGECVPPLDVADKIAVALGCGVGELLGKEG